MTERKSCPSRGSSVIGEKNFKMICMAKMKAGAGDPQGTGGHWNPTWESGEVSCLGLVMKGE